MARRSIGEVEATLSADTRKFVSEVKRVTDEAENEEVDINVGAEVDREEVQQAIRQVEQTAERAEADVNVGAEANRFDIDNTIERIVADIENEEAAIGIGAEKDTADIDAAIEDAVSDVEGKTADIRIGADISDTDVDAAIDLIKERAAEADAAVMIGGDVDTDDLDAALDLIAGEVAARRFSVNIGGEKDHFDVEAALDRIAEEVAARDPDVEIGADVDTTDRAWTKARTDMNSWGRSSGKSSGGAFRGGFMSSIGDDSFWIGVGLAIATPLASGLEGTLAAGAAIVSSAFSGAAGAVGAATPILLGGAASLAAVAVGLDGVDEALKHAKEENWEALKDAMEDLSPSAREFVGAFVEVKGALDKVRLDTQQALFEGLDDELRALADETIPDVGGALEIAATSVNEFVTKLSGVAQQTDFTEMMEAIDPALDNAFDSAVHLVATFQPFILAVAPAARDLSQWLEDGAESLKDWVIENPDKIQSFFDDGVESLMKWVSLVGQTIDLVGTLMSSGKTQGDDLVETLTNIVSRWDRWLQGDMGKQKLDDFFTGAEQTLRDMKPFLDGLVKAWDILTDEEAGGQWENLMIELGEAAPHLAELLNAIGDMELGVGIANLIDTFGVFAQLFGVLPDDVQRFAGQLLVVTKVLGPLNRALSAMNLSFGWIGLINVAATIGVAAFDAISGGADTAALSTEAVGSAWATANESIIRGAEVADIQAEAMKNLAEAVPEVQHYDRLEDAMVTLGATTDDFVDNIIGLRKEGDDAIPALENIAKNADISEEAISGLADVVADGDVNFRDFDNSLQHAIGSLTTQTDHVIPASVDSWEELADATELPMESLLRYGGVSDDVADALAKISEETGTSIEKLLETGEAMEQMQDSAEDIDLDKIAEEELRLAAVSDDTTKGILEQAAANLEMDGSMAQIIAKGEDLVPLYFEFLEVANQVATAQKDGALATDTQTAAMQTLSGAYTQAGIAAQEREAALKEERAAAYDAWQAEVQLGDSLRSTAAEVAARDFGIPAEFAEQIINLGDAWKHATDQASAFKDVMEAFRGGIPDLESAINNAEAAADEFREGMTETVTAGEETFERQIPAAIEVTRGSFGELITIFDSGEEAGRHYSESAIGWADSILDVAAANLQAGQSTEDVIADVEAMRQEMISAFIPSLEAAGHTTSEATALATEYANTLLGTPQELNTAISTPGLVEALMNADDLTVLYDDMGNPVITEFEAIGLDLTEEEMADLHDALVEMDLLEVSPTVGVDGIPGTEDDIEGVQSDLNTVDETTAEPNVQLAGHVVMIALLAVEQTMLNTLNSSVADPTLKLSDYPDFVFKMDTMQKEVATLETMAASPETTLPGYADVKSKLDTLQTEMLGLSGMHATPSVTLSGYYDTMAQIDAIQANINATQSRTVTIHTNYTTSGSRPAMAGTIVTGPGLYTLGERGYREAVVPLDLPLSRVDSSVRELAALMRGQGGVTRSSDKEGPRVQVNQVIQPISADPVDVSIQVVNRIAALME